MSFITGPMLIDTQSLPETLFFALFASSDRKVQKDVAFERVIFLRFKKLEVSNDSTSIYDKKEKITRFLIMFFLLLL